MSVTVSSVRRVALQIAAGLLAVLAVWLLTHGRPWQALEYKTYDLYTSLTAPRSSSLPVVILAIDEPTFQDLQVQWPFPRSLHARLVERLAADGAAVIAFDVVFAEPATPQDDQTFARAIAAAGNVVLAASTEMIDSGAARIWTDVLPAKQFLDAGAVTGFAGVAPDDDYVVRRHVWREDTLMARVAAIAGKPVPPVIGATMIGYIGPRGTFDTRSYYQALEPGLLPPGFFKDKIVLIGRSARTAAELSGSHADMFNSPFSAIEGDRLFPGVELQATLLHNWMSDGGIRPVEQGWVVIATVLLVILLLYAGLNMHPALFTGLTILTIAGIAICSLVLFGSERRWLPPLFPMAALAAAYGASALVSYAAARRRATRIRGMFSQYVPPEVVARLVEQPEMLRLGGETREVTLMFTDLADFTPLSEKLSAEQTVELLTEYFDAMTTVIHRYGGTIDKFIGDAIMAFWGAPLDDALHAEHAVRAAVEMHQAVQLLAQRLAARGLPPVSMRIGIHTGKAVVGNVGSQTRFSYTAVGDAVNLAARLEGANKFFGTSILVSEATAARLPKEIRMRPLDTILVKGKTKPVCVLTPCDDADLCEWSAKALRALEARQWEEGRSALEQVLARIPGDITATGLLERMAAARPGSGQEAADWQSAVALDKY